MKTLSIIGIVLSFIMLLLAIVEFNDCYRWVQMLFISIGSLYFLAFSIVAVVSSFKKKKQI
jgi:uncharacterized membrane protein YqjE